MQSSVAVFVNQTRDLGQGRECTFRILTGGGMWVRSRWQVRCILDVFERRPYEFRMPLRFPHDMQADESHRFEANLSWIDDDALRKKKFAGETALQRIGKLSNQISAEIFSYSRNLFPY